MGRSMGQTLNVLYLTWGEVPIRDGIYENQVLGQLLEIKRADPAIDLALLAGIPLINRYTTIERGAYRAGINKIKEPLAAAEIAFSTRWIGAVAKWFHAKRHHFPFFYLGQRRFLQKFIQQKGFDVIHCRGYHSAHLALLTKEKYNLDFRVLFDTRGLFPEEGLLASYYARGSQDYAKWKEVEQKILDQSDAVVNVSETFTTHINSLTKNRAVHTIHTSTDIALFQPAQQETRQSIRAEYGISESEKVLIYVGSLGIDVSWHSLSNLIDIYQPFRQAFKQTKLCIVTRSPHAPIRVALEKAGLWDESILLAANSRQETSHFLQMADYGALSYYTIEDEIERLVGYTVIASKTGEYLAMGLPMIVTQAVGAAAKLVADHGVGCTYVAGDEASITEQLLAIDGNYAAIRQRCIELAHRYFSAARNAQSYIEIYRSLKGQPFGEGC